VVEIKRESRIKRISVEREEMHKKKLLERYEKIIKEYKELMEAT
jgi:ribosomal protein S17